MITERGWTHIDFAQAMDAIMAQHVIELPYGLEASERRSHAASFSAITALLL
jgi:hypothetical protein